MIRYILASYMMLSSAAFASDKMLTKYIQLADGRRATTYGYTESNCGDPGHAVPCDSNATTASGEKFDPSRPTMAVAAPHRLPLEARDVYIRTATSQCVRVRLNDKLNERYIGVLSFDLSPAAVALLTGKPASPTWSDKIYLCAPKPLHDKTWNHKPVVRRIIVDAIH